MKKERTKKFLSSKIIRREKQKSLSTLSNLRTHDRWIKGENEKSYHKLCSPMNYNSAFKFSADLMLVLLNEVKRAFHLRQMPSLLTWCDKSWKSSWKEANQFIGNVHKPD